MIDPITAITAATTAYKTVQKLVGTYGAEAIAIGNGTAGRRRTVK